MKFHTVRPIAALLAVGCTLILSACGKVPASSAASGAAPSFSPSFSPASTVQGVEWLSDRADGYCSTSGMYHAIQREDQLAQNLFYIDFASGQEIYLCNQPNCTHDSESCPSWLPLSGAITRVVPVGDKVVILYGGVSFGQGDNALPQVLLMDPDGGNRKTIASFDASDMVAAMPRGGLARDEGHLYFVLHSRDDSQRTLYAVDIAAQQVNAVCVLPEEEEKIVGGAGSELVLSYTPGSYSLENDAADLTTQYIRLDPASGAVTPLFSRPYTDEFLGCADGKAYLLDSAGVLRSYDLQSGAPAAELQTDLPAEVLEGTPSWQLGIWDGKALISHTLSTDAESSESADATSSAAYCSIDLATGQSTRLPHVYTSEYDNQQPCTVLGQTDTQLLITSGWQSITVAYPGSGTDKIDSVSASVSTYALMGKEDFWAGRSASLPITNARS